MESELNVRNLMADASQNITERLVWHTALKDQAGIARNMADGSDIQEIYGLGEAALFDEFFCFLDELGIKNLAMKLKPKIKKRETRINFLSVFLIYVMRIVSGAPHFWNIESVLLHSQPLMHLVGFNAREIREGTSERGLHNPPKGKDQTSTPDNVSPPASVPPPTPPTTTPPPALAAATAAATPAADADVPDAVPTAPATTGNDDKIRGPVCPQFISSFISNILASALEKFFNTVISILASNSFFPKRVHALMDASEIQSTERCLGCGKVSKEKAPELRLRQKRIRKVFETVFGFKIWVVWDSVSKLPIAMRFTTIEVADVKMAREVVQQAVDNLGDKARIASLAFDRGFTDGPFMWWLHHEMGIIFYVPAKKNLHVYEDALSMLSSGIRQARERERRVGRGKTGSTVIDRWEAVGIEGLTSAGFYGEKGSGSHENSNSFKPNPINAVVVLADPYKANNPASDTMVILTNGDVAEPLRTYDGYDQRSEIENSLFREAKRAWFIQSPPENTKASFCAHVYLTIIIMALTTAFRTWMDKQEKLDRQGQETGIRKFRDRVRQENGSKFIVFEGGHYAIFDAYEIPILCGRRVLMPRGVPEIIEKRDILKKYGALLE